ncbi:SULT1 [Mytilus edulis]|uniref:SULT1 n=1 Tax=Mytilus edulis TaxID=6550 RepID=A0A8S3UD42_MYTED|nr:SULT1 [Mytilus edulis]
MATSNVNESCPQQETRNPIAVYPFYRYGKITILSTPAIKQDGAKVIQSIENFNSRETDVILCSSMKSDDLYGGWFYFTREFEKAIENKTANVLSVTFEDLKLIPIQTGKKMANFLDVNISDELIKDIFDKCAFDNLKDNKIDESRDLDPEGNSTLWRKGIIGDWKNWFTVYQSEQFDQFYDKEMKGYNRLKRIGGPFFPFIEYKSITLPPMPPIVKDVHNFMDSLRNFNSRETDVILCSPMKSGTHWVHEIVSMLLHRTTEYNSHGELNFCNFECQSDWDRLEKMNSPRFFHTHLPMEYLPRKHVENDTIYGGWFTFTKQFEKAIVEKRGSILPVTFEKLKIATISTLLEMASFLGISVDDSFIKEIADKCAFENLKKNKIDTTVSIHPEGRSTLWRKGIIGDWENWFTVEQNELFEKLYHRAMEGYAVDFIYYSPKH